MNKSKEFLAFFEEKPLNPVSKEEALKRQQEGMAFFTEFYKSVNNGDSSSLVFLNSTK